MPINNITQIISTIPEAGRRGIDVQTIFVTKQEDFQDHLQGITVVELNALVTQQNTMAGAMNSTATQVNTNANTATTQAGIATTKASEASASASQALTSRNQAETFKNSASTSASTATTKASEASASAVSASTSASTATTKASEASASAVSASTSASTATTKASEASASASTATTKASEASASAISASTSASTATTKASEASASASQALTSRNQAETFAQQASASAVSVDATNIVYRTGNQTIAGVKTFSSDIVGSITGNAATATKLATTRNIALSGDVTGNVNFDGTGNVNIATTIAPNSILLGTDTTGNYVAGATAGTGISISGTAGEGWSPTISLTNVGAAGTYRSITTDAQGRVTAGTNPTTVSGYGLTDVYTKTENNTSLALKVNNSEKGVANGIATLDTNGKVVLTQIPDSLLGQLEYIGIWNFATLPTATEKGQYWIASVAGNGYEVGDWAVWNGSAFDKVDNTDAVATVAGRTGNVVLTKNDVGLGLVDNTADASKNVLSATKWAAARTVTLSGDVAGSANIDGSANVTITTTVQPNSVALGTDTTGNYVAGVTAGTGISISGTAGEGWSPTITNIAPNVTTDITTTHNATNVVVNSSDGTDGTINGATQTLAGVMTAADKSKLDGIATGATANIGTVTSIATSGAITGGTVTSTGTIAHSTADGYLHVPATGTINSGKVLTAGATAGSLSWTALPSAPVASVAGKTGAVTLVKGDVGLGSVDNTADSAKNVLSATKLTTARTINGVAFDGTSNITVSDSTAVNLTGNQTIAGVKTFTSSPIVPVPTTDFHSVPLRSTNITVNVGPGQTYTTINKALEYLSGFYPMYKRDGVTATINLKFDFAMAEQVLVSGIDLGWITIVGEAAETYITHTALTTAFNGADYPAFGVDKGGTSPVIGQLFRFNVEKVGGNKHGLMSFGAGSSANILSGKGFIGAGTHGIVAGSGSTVVAAGANCSNAGTIGIYVVNDSAANAASANCSSAGTYGIVANNASTINCEGANCSNSGDIGMFANRASTINAISANCSNAGTIGISAGSGSTINAISANCSNAGTIGISAGSGSTINAAAVIIQNQTTGTARVRVTDGSHVEATGIDTTGGTVTVFSQAVNTLTQNGIIYQ